MVKKTTLVIVVLIVIIFSALDVYLFMNKNTTSYASISGYYLKELPEFPFGLNISIIAFIIQWIVLLLIIIYTYSKFVHRRKAEELKINFHLIRKNIESSTDLDVLYNLLKENKSLTIGTISKLFKITKEKAVEWAKILENHDLAVIEYPAFSDPEVRIHEKDEEKQQKQREEEKTERKQKGKERGREERQRGKPNFKEIGIPVPKAPISTIPKPPNQKAK